MVSSHVLLRKSSNIENYPPHANITRSKAARLAEQTIVREASRRRRARYQVGVRAPEHLVQEALRKTRQARINISLPVVSRDVEMKDVEAKTTRMTVELPKRLIRPEMPSVQSKYLAVIDPELRDTPVQYIVDHLHALGRDMMKVLMSVKAEAEKNVLPTELDVVVNDVSAEPPTHLLAIHAMHQKPGARKITLYPVHHLVLASQCSKLPALPVSPVERPSAPGERVTLPVVTLGVPDPEAFPLLSAFLYTSSTDHILAGLLPTPPPKIDLRDPDTVDICTFVNHLAGTYTVQALFAHCTKVSGFFRTTCALGVQDDALWRVIHFCWNVLISALAISTGQPENTPSLPGSPQ